jgi:hypothetical protein
VVVTATHSDWQSGDRTSVEIYRAVQTCPRPHPISFTMGTGSFSEIKRPERAADHPTPSSAGLRMGWSYYLRLPSLSGQACYWATFLLLLLPVALRPDSGSWLPLTVLHDHTQTHHTQEDSSERVISWTQRHLRDNTQHSQQTDHVPGGIRTHNPRKRAAVDSHIRPRGNQDRQGNI